MKDIGHFLLWGYKDTEQKQRIEALERRTRQDLTDLERTRNLEWRVENLILLNQAMWNLVRDKVGVTEEELINEFERLDLADGKADGRMSPIFDNKPWKCEGCQKDNSPRFTSCVRCDKPLSRKGATEAFKKIT